MPALRGRKLPHPICKSPVPRTFVSVKASLLAPSHILNLRLVFFHPCLQIVYSQQRMIFSWATDGSSPWGTLWFLGHFALICLHQQWNLSGHWWWRCSSESCKAQTCAKSAPQLLSLPVPVDLPLKLFVLLLSHSYKGSWGLGERRILPEQGRKWTRQ